LFVDRIKGDLLTPKFQTQMREGDFGRAADMTRATEVLKWKPKVAFQDGLRRTFEWILEDIISSSPACSFRREGFPPSTVSTLIKTRSTGPSSLPPPPPYLVRIGSDDPEVKCRHLSLRHSRRGGGGGGGGGAGAHPPAFAPAPASPQ